MSRDRYLKIKSHFHLENNQRLEAGNKVLKIKKIYKQLSDNCIKFGLFYKNLSVDESMVPYCGEHSANIVYNKQTYSIWVKDIDSLWR